MGYGKEVSTGIDFVFFLYPFFGMVLKLSRNKPDASAMLLCLLNLSNTFTNFSFSQMKKVLNKSKYKPKKH